MSVLVIIIGGVSRLLKLLLEGTTRPNEATLEIWHHFFRTLNQVFRHEVSPLMLLRWWPCPLCVSRIIINQRKNRSATNFYSNLYENTKNAICVMILLFSDYMMVALVMLKTWLLLRLCYQIKYWLRSSQKHVRLMLRSGPKYRWAQLVVLH